MSFGQAPIPTINLHQMDIAEFKPHKQLLSYIDTYWNATCKTDELSIDTITPDGWMY